MTVEVPKQEIIEGQIIALDYSTFANKHFVKCKLIYKGGRPPVAINCLFDQCEFIFEGPALATVRYLASMARDAAGGREMVLQMLGIKP